MIFIKNTLIVVILGISFFKQIFRPRTNFCKLKSGMNRNTKVFRFLTRVEVVKTVVSKINDLRTENKTEVILLCIGSLGNGGAERQWANIAIGLKHKGYNPIVVTESNLTEASNWIVNDLEAFNIPIIAISDKLIRNKEFLINKYKFLFLEKKFDKIYNKICQKIDSDDVFISVCEIVKEYRPTAIVTALDPININFCLSGLLENVPKLIISFRSVAPDNYKDLVKMDDYDFEIYKYLYFNSRIMITSNSEHGVQSYRNYFQDVDENVNVKIIPNSTVLTDTTIKKLMSSSSIKCCSKFHIFGAMRFSPEKSPHSWLDFIEFIHLGNQSNFHFILYGSGIQKKEVLSRIYYLKSHGVNIDYGGYSDFIFNIFYVKGLILSTSLFEGHSNLEEEARLFDYKYIKTFEQKNINIKSTNKYEYSSQLTTLRILDETYNQIIRASREKMTHAVNLKHYSVTNSRTLRLQVDAFIELFKL